MLKRGQMVYFPTGFDRRRAIELAGLVSQAYPQLEAFKMGQQWRPQGGYTLTRELVAAGLPIGFIARKAGDVYLVFRGTMTTAEWMKDLSIRLTPFRYGIEGNVHEGFIRMYDSLRDAILETLRGLPPRGRLFIAGHSLGAGLATLAAADVPSNSGFRAPTLYTYGSPRVGDRSFAAGFNRAFAGRSFRIANTSDFVTSVPFPGPILGFLGGYFTHVDVPVDFTTQEEDSEKNHDMKTYTAALKVGAERGGLLASVFGRGA